MMIRQPGLDLALGTQPSAGHGARVIQRVLPERAVKLIRCSVGPVAQCFGPQAQRYLLIKHLMPAMPVSAAQPRHMRHQVRRIDDSESDAAKPGIITIPERAIPHPWLTESVDAAERIPFCGIHK